MRDFLIKSRIARFSFLESMRSNIFLIFSAVLNMAIYGIFNGSTTGMGNVDKEVGTGKDFGFLGIFYIKIPERLFFSFSTSFTTGVGGYIWRDKFAGRKRIRVRFCAPACPATCLIARFAAFASKTSKFLLIFAIIIVVGWPNIILI